MKNSSEAQREALEVLKASDAVTVGADMIAPCLKMSAGVLRKHVRDGTYTISKTDVCGGRVRFFREDFLRQVGELPPETPERTVAQVLEELLDEISRIRVLMQNKSAR